MDPVARNAFELIVIGAKAAFAKPGPGVKDQALLSLTMIEGQCEVLREVLGDGDGLDQPASVDPRHCEDESK